MTVLHVAPQAGSPVFALVSMANVAGLTSVWVIWMSSIHHPSSWNSGPVPKIVSQSANVPSLSAVFRNRSRMRRPRKSFSENFDSIHVPLPSEPCRPGPSELQMLPAE